MYVCLCNAVTESQIREAACEGSCSLRQLRACLGVAAHCGKCAQMARQVLNDTLRDLPAEASLKVA